MKIPRVFLFLVLLDETEFETIDAYKILIAFPEPDGLAFVKLVASSRGMHCLRF